ncbi:MULTISPECIES: ATP synthase subunit I [Acinetobacter]|jgi:ATP synthase protein I|nr:MULTISPECIES: ATP synthase subunit I [Acinetobacter]MCU4612793.1 ATP synthase subunit I [Acinetobacter parvus]MCY6413415.1 ATP synthase subunit I [Acinetobacter thutiue]MDH0031862.1 ATP synthase subunit I [Acinetobacter sp. GD04021]MDH0887625.1 ATP synthase subunit I [Acinetobacter sp. GD03873]MDH1083867.1 ATP synthase subunit I [Acinetobacter sp. GD03983]
MSRTSRLIDRRLAKALVFLQACMIPVAALLAWLIKDTTAALSAALGALVCWLAHCYFAWQSFRTAGARASRQVMLNMYRGMLGKFAIVIVGFILILSNVKPLSAVALFCGFILVQAMSWVAPFWVSRLQQRE